MTNLKQSTSVLLRTKWHCMLSVLYVSLTISHQACPCFILPHIQLLEVRYQAKISTPRVS